MIGTLWQWAEDPKGHDIMGLVGVSTFTFTHVNFLGSKVRKMPQQKIPVILVFKLFTTVIEHTSIYLILIDTFRAI